jgi:hypothetical protein
MIQLGTDPFCIIFPKQYNWGLSPIVLFLLSLADLDGVNCHQ